MTEISKNQISYEVFLQKQDSDNRPLVLSLLRVDQIASLIERNQLTFNDLAGLWNITLTRPEGWHKSRKLTELSDLYWSSQIFFSVIKNLFESEGAAYSTLPLDWIKEITCVADAKLPRIIETISYSFADIEVANIGASN